jgi:hypothetical protein
LEIAFSQRKITKSSNEIRLRLPWTGAWGISTGGAYKTKVPAQSLDDDEGRGRREGRNLQIVSSAAGEMDVGRSGGRAFDLGNPSQASAK